MFVWGLITGLLIGGNLGVFLMALFKANKV
jgi:hypothetical protein